MRCACGEMCGLTERAVQRHAVAYMCSLLIDGIAIHVDLWAIVLWIYETVCRIGLCCR